LGLLHFDPLCAVGETCLCGVDASGAINYNDDTCSVCSCGSCPPQVNNAVAPTPNPSGPSPSPQPSPSPSPSPEATNPNVTRLTLRTGLTLPYLNGSSLFYNGTIDARISTQENASYTNYQGHTQFWPHAGQWDGLLMGVSDIAGGYASRVLLRFNNLHLLMPASANISRARLLLKFENWAPTSPLTVGKLLLVALAGVLCSCHAMQRSTAGCTVQVSHPGLVVQQLQAASQQRSAATFSGIFQTSRHAASNQPGTTAATTAALTSSFLCCCVWAAGVCNANELGRHPVVII